MCAVVGTGSRIVVVVVVVAVVDVVLLGLEEDRLLLRGDEITCLGVSGVIIQRPERWPVVAVTA